MKHYDMRRETRMLTDEQCREILNTGEYCIVATKDEDGWPYSVPLSYALIDGKLCFHTTNTFGHKLEDFACDDRVSATVVTDVKAFFAEGDFSSEFSSVIVRGRVQRVTDSVTMRKILVALCMKYSPEHKADIGQAMAANIAQTATWIIEPELMSGKRRTQG